MVFLLVSNQHPKCYFTPASLIILPMQGRPLLHLYTGFPFIIIPGITLPGETESNKLVTAFVYAF